MFAANFSRTVRASHEAVIEVVNLCLSLARTQVPISDRELPDDDDDDDAAYL